MAEVTRVPLQPIKQGSLTKLWLGVVVVLGLAFALAWNTVPKGVSVTENVAGVGGTPALEDVVFVNYVGKLADGTVFEESQPFAVPVPGIFPEGTPLLLSQMIPGFQEGITQMQKGGSYTLEIPAAKAYGEFPPPGSEIPANADLVFEIELVDFMTQQDAERRFQMVEQVLQSQAPPPEAEQPAEQPASE